MLVCKSRYKSSLGVFQEGDIIDDVALEDALLKDSAGSFEPMTVYAHLVPQEDKMVRRGRPRKEANEVIE
jgi:hypothetical protein